MNGMGKLSGRPLGTLDNHTLTIVGPRIGAKHLSSGCRFKRLWVGCG